MSRYRLEVAVAADSEGLCRLFRETPMHGAIRVAMERVGDFFQGAGVQSTKSHVLIARDKDTGTVVASCAAGTRDVYVNGETRPVFYIGDLRIHPASRGGVLLARGFRLLHEQVMNQEGDFAQTLVLQGNTIALALLTSGRAGLPRYSHAGDYDCFAIKSARAQRPSRRGLSIRRASLADIPAMQALFDHEAPKKQFYPVYRFREIGTSSYFSALAIEDFWLAQRGSELVGMAAAWDQSRFKRTRILGYSTAMATMRPALNQVAKLYGGFRLPTPGTAMAHLCVSAVVCRQNDPAVFQALIAAMREHCADGAFEYLLCGLDRRDPLRRALRGFPKLNHPGKHFLVSYTGNPTKLINPGLFYFDTARI